MLFGEAQGNRRRLTNETTNESFFCFLETVNTVDDYIPHCYQTFYSNGWSRLDSGRDKNTHQSLGTVTRASPLDGVARNRPIYEAIAREHADAGYDRTWQQCRTKIKNLQQCYRKVKLAMYFVCHDTFTPHVL